MGMVGVCVSTYKGRKERVTQGETQEEEKRRKKKKGKEKKTPKREEERGFVIGFIVVRSNSSYQFSNLVNSYSYCI